MALGELNQCPCVHTTTKAEANPPNSHNAQGPAYMGYTHRGPLFRLPYISDRSYCFSLICEWRQSEWAYNLQAKQVKPLLTKISNSKFRLHWDIYVRKSMCKVYLSSLHLLDCVTVGEFYLKQDSIVTNRHITGMTIKLLSPGLFFFFFFLY